VFVVCLVAYAITTMKLPPGAALSCAVASGSVVVVLTPLVGALTDRVGRRPLILACALLNLVFDYPLFLFPRRHVRFAADGTDLQCRLPGAVYRHNPVNPGRDVCCSAASHTRFHLACGRHG
jgi:hypothetical protein